MSVIIVYSVFLLLLIISRYFLWKDLNTVGVADTYEADHYEKRSCGRGYKLEFDNEDYKKNPKNYTVVEAINDGLADEKIYPGSLVVCKFLDSIESINKLNAGKLILYSFDDHYAPRLGKIKEIKEFTIITERGIEVTKDSVIGVVVGISEKHH